MDVANADDAGADAAKVVAEAQWLLERGDALRACELLVFRVDTETTLAATGSDASELLARGLAELRRRPYHALGLDDANADCDRPDADPTTERDERRITQAFRRAALRTHPDKVSNGVAHNDWLP